MKSILTSAAILCAACLICGPATAGEYDKYLWETPRVKDIDARKAAPMVEELDREVQKILATGSLAPLRLTYADLTVEAYWLYYERGRIITTLAYAYPHVDKARQEGIRKYVGELLAKDSDAPWTPGIKKRDEGVSRQLHGMQIAEGPYVDAKNCPTLHVLYGLWLYGDRTGDWDAIKESWPKIAAFYAANAGTNILYGQMSAHIAMARLAKRFDDAKTQTLAEESLAKDFAAGQDPATIEARVKKTRFGKFYDERGAFAFAGQPWMFLDASPEVMRFVKDNIKGEAVKRIDAMEKTYPAWWLAQAPYFTRWTGDEGVGTPSEIFGMIFPVERWVKDTPSDTLAKYMRSIPTGVGDCYWLESLVQAIEANGTLKWERAE